MVRLLSGGIVAKQDSQRTLNLGSQIEQVHDTHPTLFLHHQRSRLRPGHPRRNEDLAPTLGLDIEDRRRPLLETEGPKASAMQRVEAIVDGDQAV
jgi:hypothetical protein